MPCRRSFSPFVEVLEDRLAPDANSVLFSLTTQRSWITYAPSTQAGQAYPCAPTTAHIQEDLIQLYDEGWRGLVTYNLLGNYAQIPQIAKNLPGGKEFDFVIAGIYFVDPDSPASCNFDDPHQEELDNATNPAIAQFIDGYLVGNEGLGESPARYTLADLQNMVSVLRSNPISQDKAIATSEISDVYLNGISGWTAQDLADFRDVGDWWFPNINFYCWNDSPTEPADTWNNVGFAYNALQQIANPLGKVVVVHESWYPTAGDTFASEDNQAAYFQLMAEAQSPYFSGPFYFVWGEAYDQSWKSGEACNQGPNWGFHGNRPDVKANKVITTLQSYYTGNYRYARTIDVFLRNIVPFSQSVGPVALQPPAPLNEVPFLSEQQHLYQALRSAAHDHDVAHGDSTGPNKEEGIIANWESIWAELCALVDRMKNHPNPAGEGIGFDRTSTWEGTFLFDDQYGCLFD